MVRTLDEGLPLFPTDNNGFPRVSVVYGRRYWPAVRAYLDFRMDLPDSNLPVPEDSIERISCPPPSPWQGTPSVVVTVTRAP